MNRRYGFTLVELLVTITIMVILLTLAVVNLRSSQMSARDDQRTADVTAIAQQLENFYKAGSDVEAAGQYPPTDDMATEANIKSALRDINAEVLRAPGVADSSSISLIISTDTDPTAPVATTSTYVYQPLQSDGSLCISSGDECRKFILYYTLESEPGVIKKIVSKNQ